MRWVTRRCAVGTYGDKGRRVECCNNGEMNLFQPNFDHHSGVAFLTKRVVGHFTTFTVGEGPLEPSEDEFGISRIAERRLQVTIFQLLGSLVENCHGCIGKGEGRAQVLHGGRKVPVARQGREESKAVRQTCAFAMLQFSLRNCNVCY